MPSFNVISHAIQILLIAVWVCAGRMWVIFETRTAWGAQGVLGLSKEQKEQILAHRHVKLVSLARLVQERRELQARLQVWPPLPPGSSVRVHIVSVLCLECK